MTRRKSMTKDINNTNDQQKKYRLGAVSKNSLLNHLSCECNTMQNVLSDNNKMGLILTLIFSFCLLNSDFYEPQSLF